MDRPDNGPQRRLILNHRRQQAGLILFGAIVLALLCIKSFQDSWFEPRTPLPLTGRPAFILFTLGHGCQCQMTVVQNAEAQISTWKFPSENATQLLHVDFNRRPDLAEQYDVIRAPALVLLNTRGEVAWKQDVGISDTEPLDLQQAEQQLKALLEDSMP